MKRFTVLTLSMLIILLASLTVSPVVASSDYKSSIYDLKDLADTSLDQAENNNDQYYPIFDSVESTDTTLTVRDRNNTLGEGAIVQVESYANITFRYAVALNNDTDFDSSRVNFRLFADIPEVNNTNFNNTNTPTLDLDGTGLPLSYVNENTTNLIDYTAPYGVVLPNATLYYFETTTVVNVTAQYIPFYVRDTNTDGLGENQNDGPYNLLTTQTYFNTSSQDEFYIQNEIVNITGSVFFVSTNDGFGISYQVNSGTLRFSNFTLTGSTNETSEISLNDYNPGTVITWDSILYVANDTLLNLSRSIERIDSKRVEVGDGSPELTVEINPNHPRGLIVGENIYSQNFSITFTVVASVPKGNISTVGIYPAESSTSLSEFDPINDSLSDIELNQTVDYSILTDAGAENGVFNSTISTTTEKGLTLNKTYTINIDQVIPVIRDLSVIGGSNVLTDDGKVTFNFDFEDEDSGVRMAILNLGNGVTVDVAGMDSYTHRYRNFQNNVYEISLTVHDYAGNEHTLNAGTITLSQNAIDTERAPSLGIFLFFIVLILTLTSFWWGPKLVERFRN